MFEHISLDGVIQVRGSGEDGAYPYGGWTAPHSVARSSICCLAVSPTISGRASGKALSSPMSDGLNAATKYIATHRPESLEYGRSTPTSTLLERGLADEVLLIVYPVLLGQGKCFFS